jgi:hypothetical protein
MSKITNVVGNLIVAGANSVTPPKHPGVITIRHIKKSDVLQNLSANGLVKAFSAAAHGTARTSLDMSAAKRATMSITRGSKNSPLEHPKFREFLANAVGGTLRSFQDAAVANAPTKFAASHRNDAIRFNKLHLSDNKTD